MGHSFTLHAWQQEFDGDAAGPPGFDQSPRRCVLRGASRAMLANTVFVWSYSASRMSHDRSGTCMYLLDTRTGFT